MSIIFKVLIEIKIDIFTLILYIILVSNFNNSIFILIYQYNPPTLTHILKKYRILYKILIYNLWNDQNY